MNKKRIVITGMGTISPCGNTIPEFWENMIQGNSGIKRVTKFDPTDFKCQVGGEVKNFNPIDHGMTPKEVKRLDPFVQYTIAASNMAIKNSGIILNEENHNVSVILGVGIGGFQTFETAEAALFKKDIVSPLTIPMLMPNAAAAEISIRHKIHGPAFTINAACASSLYAIIQSIVSLQSGLTDVVITGGTEAAISPLSYIAFTNMKALTINGNDIPEQASRPFDAHRSGFVMAEGSAVLVIETLDHALARNAEIIAEIIGFGTSSDAYHITAPGKGIYSAIQNTLKTAEIEPSAIDYINAHGTSTELNDKLESIAIQEMFGEKVPVSSTKSMTGHLLGGAAALETIVCVKTIQEGIIAPTINYQTPDPECGKLNYIANESIKADVQIAMNNSLGFGGHNACLILKRYE